MGWTYMRRPAGQTTAAIIQREVLDGPGPFDRDEKIIESAMIGGVLYAAVLNLDTGMVSGMVVLTGGRGGQWGYKAMDEREHPFYYDAPARILNALRPTDNPHALAWRAACRATLAGREVAS